VIGAGSAGPRRPGVLTGTVRGPGGAPAPDAVVEVANSAGDVVDQVIVDDEGRYTYHLSEGTWSLRAWDSHGGRTKEAVSLVQGENRTLNLELKEVDR
jgi:hypothetical protein